MSVLCSVITFPVPSTNEIISMENERPKEMFQTKKNLYDNKKKAKKLNEEAAKMCNSSFCSNNFFRYFAAGH